MSGRGTNIFDHVVDDASTVTVELSTTSFTSEPNVQSCLEQIDPHALKPLDTYPIASETVVGMTRIATEAEAIDVTVDDAVLTPLKMELWLNSNGQATEGEFGVAKIITTDELDNVDEDTKIITSKKLNEFADTVRLATEGQTGFARLATEAEAVSGSGDGVMTPQRTVQAIQAWAGGSNAQATTTAKGLVRLATGAEAAARTDGTIALTPANINSLTPTETLRGGFFKLSTAAANSRTSTDHAIAVGDLGRIRATSTMPGTVNLVNNLTTNSTTAALTAAMGKKLNDEKIGSSGGTINGTLKVNTITSTGGASIMSGGKFTSASMLNMYPVGAIYLSLSGTNPASIFGGSWRRKSQGRLLMGTGGTTDSRGEYRSYGVNNTGGEYRHVLSTSEMPSHKHAGWGESSGSIGWGVASQYGRNNVGSSDTDRDNYLYYSEPVGGNQPHNNMQPYFTVYVWERYA